MMAAGPPPSSFQTSAWLPSDADSAAIGNVISPLEASSTSNNVNRAAVAVACVQCRSRHLKCDGAARCSRCVAEGIACTYVKSRRGWKGPRKSTRLQSAPVNAASIGMIRKEMKAQILKTMTLTIDRSTRTSRNLCQLCITTGYVRRSSKSSRSHCQDS